MFNVKRFLVLFLWLLLFALSANKADAATYFYTLSNLQSTSCTVGSEYTPMNLTSSGDIVQVFGYNFGNRSIDDNILEMIYLQINTSKWEIYRGMRSEGIDIYFGPISWTDNQINFEVKPGFGNLIGSDFILRTHSSSADNKGSCVRGILTPGLICTSFTYSDWSTCSTGGQQTRTVLSSLPNGCTGGSPILTQSCTPACTTSDYSCNNWSDCSINNSQSRTCTKISNCEGGTPMPATSQSCTYTPPVCNSWTYSDWSDCQPNNTQTRTITSSSPDSCSGGNPILTQSCSYTISVPIITSISPDIIYPGTEITINGKNFGQYDADCYILCYPKNRVKINNVNLINSSDDLPKKNWTDIRVIVKLPSNAKSGYITVADKDGNESNKYNFTITPKPTSCTYNNWSCTDWSSCSANGTQSRNCNKILNCQGGVSSPATSQSCAYTPACTSNSWSCGSWSECSSNGTKTRECNKISNCEGGTQSPATTQPCTYIPACSADTWQCGDWGTCSPQGTQTRSCTRTYDCPTAETAAPATAQYCQPSSNPTYQSPADTQNVTNQESIIRATVKLKCPVTSTRGWEGSGTVIDSKGTILTNKHVIADTAGCYVGFIDSYKDVPYFGNRQIADIYKVSSNEDIALLKLRNPNNKSLPFIDISQGNNNSLKPTNKLVIYGYPGIGGDTITVTPGYYNGVSGNYLKTDAKIAHGNSGGGAYTTNGIFMGIPTGAKSDDITNLGYVLSINTINSWMNNTPIAYSPPNTNNYSRVASILENMTVGQINQLQLYVPGTEPTDSSQENKNKVLGVVIDIKLANRLKGYILLQVESRGEGWYVYPDDKKKYYLGRPADAFSIMRNLGLGIKHSELTGYINAKFPSRLSGKILIDVDQMGEAWYISPKDKKAYFLGNPSQAFSVMRILGLGITNADIRKIEVGEIK